MDHQAFAQLLGNYGEFLGAIAVVVTLIYLAGQLRQNTKALRASSNDAYSTAGTAVNDFAARHANELAKLAEVEVDLFIYYNYAQRLFNLMEATYLRHRERLMDDAVFEARVRGFRFLFGQESRLLEAWENSRAFYTDEFLAFMDKRVVDGGDDNTSLDFLRR